MTFSGQISLDFLDVLKDNNMAFIQLSSSPLSRKIRHINTDHIMRTEELTISGLPSHRIFFVDSSTIVVTDVDMDAIYAGSGVTLPSGSNIAPAEAVAPTPPDPIIVEDPGDPVAPPPVVDPTPPDLVF